MNLNNVLGERYPGATAEELLALTAQVGPSLPAAYLQLLRHANGIHFENGAVLYRSSQVGERNETYEVSRYAPLSFAIGDDGGGGLILVERTSAASSQVLLIGSGSLGAAPPQTLAESIEGWVATGCPTSLSEDDVPEFADMYFVAVPTGGAQSLIVIKTELGLETGLGDLVRGLKNLSFRVLTRVPYGKYLQRVRRINSRFGECLELSAVE